MTLAETGRRKPLVTIGGRPVWPQMGPAAPRGEMPAVEEVAVARVAMVERLRATAALRHRRTLRMCVAEISTRRPWLLPALILAILGIGVLMVGIGAGRTKSR
jgi:hypothetical protein